MTNNNMYLPVGRTQTQWSESIQVLCTCIDSDDCVCVLPTGKYILLLVMYYTGKLRLLSHNTCIDSDHCVCVLPTGKYLYYTWLITICIYLLVEHKHNRQSLYRCCVIVTSVYLYYTCNTYIDSDDCVCVLPTGKYIVISSTCI
jgi:hypothetical protein